MKGNLNGRVRNHLKDRKRKVKREHPHRKANNPIRERNYKTKIKGNSLLYRGDFE